MKIKEITNIHLVDFIKHSEKLTSLYQVQRDDYDENWIDIKTSISNSIISLYKFSNLLFFSNKFKNNKNDLRFYAFYFDLILSKLRHSLFTETPKKSYLDIHTYTAEDIAYIGEELLNNSELSKDFEIDFQRFVFKIFMMYDFIFYEENGIFTRFKLDASIYSKIKKEVFTFENKRDSSIRDYGKEIIENILSITIKNQNYTYDDTKNIYENFINISIDKNKEILLIEPLGYYLAFKIWKIAKVIQSTLEFKKTEDMQVEKEKFKNIFTNYLNESKDIISHFYDGKITNREFFHKMAILDKKIISEHLLVAILPAYKKQDFSLCQLNYNNNIQYEVEENSLSGILDKMISNKEHDRFKFYRVLEDKNITISDIGYIIKLLSNQMPSCEEDFEIVGMLRSGVLLAHCINVSNSFNKPIYMFSSFPYISMLPRTALSTGDRIVFIDESIKSAFSTVLATLYKQRTNYFNNISTYNYTTSVNTIVNFKNFKKSNLTIPYKSITTLESKDGKVENVNSTAEDDTVAIDIFDWCDYFKQLKSPSINFKDITININSIDRLDITRILADSHLLFQIAKVFAEKVSTIDDENIIIYSSTDEGKLLVDATIFAYKAMFPDKPKQFILNKKLARQKFKTSKLIFVDMTIDTLHTIKRALKVDFDTSIGKLDLALTILSSQEAIDELSDNILLKIDMLRKDEKNA